MPMDIKSAPAWFQRFIESILQEFDVKDTLSVYLYDIIIFSPILEAHTKVVREVIERLQAENMKASFEKSQLNIQKLQSV